MKKSFNIALYLIFFFIGLKSDINFAQEINLWPEIEPYYTDYLKVSDIHEIYYELCGNPKGKPVFVLHGGPGGSCSPYMRQFFNPEKFHVILHDQRGAGKSEPNAEIKENTTEYLVEDIPIIMVNGRYDMICPPITAYKIHSRLPKSKLIIAESSGHWMGEKPIERELLKAMMELQ